MAFQKSFNELLNEILTNYRNQFPGDVTPGSVLFVKASCTASMLWGLYRQLDRAADQMFVGTADRAHKERHAAEFGIVTAGKTDAEITDAVLEAKRSKLAGGNRYDYAAWAREAMLGDESVTYAAVVELAQGEDTFDIVVVSTNRDGETNLPVNASQGLLDKVKSLCQSRRPVGSGFSWGMRVVAAAVKRVSVRIQGTGANWNKEATAQSVIDYVNGLVPGQKLVRALLVAMAHEYGADSAEVVEPPADVVPLWTPAAGMYEVLRCGETALEVAP
jgi:uncharacterized phage protein gp47/JayE